jgi:hypothetical protein
MKRTTPAFEAGLEQGNFLSLRKGAAAVVASGQYSNIRLKVSPLAIAPKNGSKCADL